MLTDKHALPLKEADPDTDIKTGLMIREETERLAQQMAARSLINAFLRENVDAIEHLQSLAEAAEKGAAVPVTLMLGDGARLHGTVQYASLIGQHVYADEWMLEAGEIRRLLTFHELAERLVLELAQRLHHRRQRPLAVDEVLRRIGLSVRYLHGHLVQREEDAKAGKEVRRLDYIRSEQSVFAGHPFHPYPKSVEGMDEVDLDRYSPERGASFALYYFAVSKSALHGEWLPGERSAMLPEPIREPYREALVERIGTLAEDMYEPLPMHPWQARQLLGQPRLRRALERGELVPLGPLGPKVFPTSSVRTVWEPGSGCGWKLPLGVRITNLIRVNTAEQTTRTMHAAQLTARLGDDLRRELPGLMPETGYAGIAEAGDAILDPSITVMFRPLKLDPSSSFVLASLVESWPGERAPKLAQAIAESAQAGGTRELPDMQLWLERYLQLSMLPLLRVWDRYGISFEAHAQNSLLALKGGWPSAFYTRDLEGMSVDRQVAEAAGWIGELLPENSPLLYNAAEAWRRTLYYYFVNHLGSLIHAWARCQNRPEGEGWDVVRHLLLAERARASARLLPYIDGLLTEQTLPAKANFSSCLVNKGDTPLYIMIANPMRDGRR